jgi:hypothetical protein
MPSTVIQTQTQSDVWEYRRGAWFWAGENVLPQSPAALPR